MLVSPGTEITVTDESQYLPTAVGTVPFIVFATAENKIFNDSVAPYTTKANAGKLLAVTSQRDLVTNFGYPIFKQSSAGTPLHGNELNEYGLMTAYSALGSCNRAYLIRADIDLNQLTGTAVRPIGDPANGTYWLDLSNSAWGIYEWNAASQDFVNKLPLLLTNAASTSLINGILTPVTGVGSIGSYAIVAGSPRNYVFYKRYDNIWTQVGGTEWQKAFPTVSGTITAGTTESIINVPYDVLNPDSIILNSVEVKFTGTTLTSAVDNINSANIPGVTARIIDLSSSGSGRIAMIVTSEAMSNGSNADGQLRIIDGFNSPASKLGLAPGIYAAPILEYNGYVSVPDWRQSDLVPRPSGSIWAKTTAVGVGANITFKMYDQSIDQWTPVTTPIYADESSATYALDPIAGGFEIQAGTVFIRQDDLNNSTMSYRPYIRGTQGVTSISGTAPSTTPAFALGDSFKIAATQAGVAAMQTYTVTINQVPASGGVPGVAEFVSAVLAANIPGVVASADSNNIVTFTHQQGGEIILSAGTQGSPLVTAGFTSATIGVRVNAAGSIVLSNWVQLIYTYSFTKPYTAPNDGTLWFYNSPLDVDIMINETDGWKGYRKVSRDARGNNLVNTDPAGPIMSPTAPQTQSDNTPIVAGDLWINTGDLANFPVISRWSGQKWQLIDNADYITQNGIVFADARWDASGIADPAAAAFPPIGGTTADALNMSNYVDLDCPDHRLYPRGTLLFNLRRSGFNVKHYVSNYFDDDAFPDATLPAQKATWVTSSGLQNNGSPFMGSKAQRAMVVKALKAAIDGSETAREETFAFNLLATPGYEELISNMVQLNNDRKNTGFILGDTPMHLPANITAINDWSTGRVAGGLTTADPYMAVYYPSGLANDLQGNTIVMPPSHMILRAAIKSDNVSYPWFAFAGTRRGLIDNTTDIGYVDTRTGAFVRNGLNQGMRDALYQLNINPITLLPNIGLVNFGNKTRSGTASSMDRVNVARLVNYIRTILSHVGDSFLFEPNDAITRSQIKQVISSALNDLIAKRGVYDYLVVCDESNNTNDRIARNELYVDIAIEPMKSVEFIYIPIRLKNPGGIKASGK